MNKSKKNIAEITPGDIFHPGEYIKDELESRSMSQQELAEKMNVSKSEISLIIHGHRNINPKIAVLLEIVLKIDAEFWMNLQVKYDIDKIKSKMQKSVKTAKIPSDKKRKFKKSIAAA